MWADSFHESIVINIWSGLKPFIKFILKLLNNTSSCRWTILKNIFGFVPMLTNIFNDDVEQSLQKVKQLV